VTILLEATLKISLVITLGLIAVMLFRRRSAALRHWILATAVAAALATPLLMSLAPSWSLPAGIAADAAPRPRAASGSARRAERIGITTTVDVPPGSAQPVTTSFTIASVLVAVWIVGLAVNLSGLGVGLWRLRRLGKRATTVHDGPWAESAHELRGHFRLGRPVRLLQSDQAAVLMTWGVLNPRVMLPAGAPSWDGERIRIVLAHELAHVQRRDWIVQIGSEVLRSLFWFNPLVWLASWRLRLESERACDDAVVNLGVSGGDYATHLLELAQQFGRARALSFPAVAIVPRPSSLERRVTAMLNPGLNRRPLSAFARLAIAGTLAAVALPIALFAQQRFATLSGSVTDPSGGLLPGVTVVATDTTRNANHQVLTNRAGQFEIIGLPEGPHVLTVTLPGFQTYEQNLTMSGEDMSRNVTLRVGSLQETITVTREVSQEASRPVVQAPRSAPKPASECGAAVAGRGAAPTGLLRIGGQIKQPTKTRHVSPVYPDGSTPGIVILEAVIGPDGHVDEIKVLRTPGTALSLSAETAVRQWEFTPTLLNCAPIPVRMNVTVDFN
jgi:beta-lactamase regulating signal transducer with metallopeptidase domain